MTMQAKEPSVSPVHPGKASDAAKAMFAAGGLLAAFGVASCCALPVALSLFGVSAVSLVAIGYLAAQYQQELFYVATACLGVAAFLILRQRRGRTCTVGAARYGSVLDWGSSLAVLLAFGLLVLTFWIEGPL